VATELRWYRSWPQNRYDDDSRHAHVVDHLPRVEIAGYDYMTATDGLPIRKPGFCMLEWDLALESAERRRFAMVAARFPDSVLVAPYNLYPIDGNPQCAHRYNGGTPVRTGSPVCDTFGLGCVYLPASILTAFLTSESASLGMTDASLSRFVLNHYGQTRIDWSFAPQHLSGD
jgi:hypothetical protein